MRTRPLVALAVALSCAAPVQPAIRAAQADPQTTAPQTPTQTQQTVQPDSGLNMSGSVLRNGKAAPGVRLRARNLDKNTVVGYTVSDPNGAYFFTVPEPGLYVIEAVKDDDSGVIGISQQVSVTTAAHVADVILASQGAIAAFFTSTAFLVAAAATGAGFAIGAIEDNNNPPVSPER